MKILICGKPVFYLKFQVEKDFSTIMYVITYF